MQTTTAEVIDDLELDALDAEIAALSESFDMDEVIEQSEALTEDEISAVDKSLKLDKKKKEVYKTASKKEEPVVAKSEEEKPAKVKKTKAVKAAPASVYFQLEEGSSKPPEDEHKEVLDILGTMNIKGRDHAQGILNWAFGSKALGVYDRIGLKYLIEQGSFTVKTLSDFFLDGHKNGNKSYSKGTANAQAFYVKTALTALKVVRLDGGAFVPNPDSKIYNVAKNQL